MDNTVLKKALLRLSNVNSKLSDLQWNNYVGDDNNIKSCAYLCRYFRIRMKLPPKDIINNFGNLTEEILYMSGLCCKEVQLSEDWWKHENGPMLGEFSDGSPAVLIPGTLFGYYVYDPAADKSKKVTAKNASKIKLTARAIFRTFHLDDKINFKSILEFILNGNIYKEIAVILICSFLGGIISVIPPIISAQIFDVTVPEKQGYILIQTVLILIAFSMADIGFSIITNLGISRINTKTTLAIQVAVWNRLLGLKMPFFSGYTKGELLQKIKSLQQIKNLVSVESVKTVISNLFIFVNVIVLFNYCGEITPDVLLMFLILFVIYGAISVKKYSLYKKYTDAENKSATLNRQIISAIHRIKSSSAQERIYNIWSQSESEKRHIKNKIKSLDNFFESFFIFFQLFSTSAVYFWISQTGGVAAGAFVAYISTFLMLVSSSKRLTKALNVLPELISVCNNIKPVLVAEPEYNSQKTIPKDMDGSIQADHVTFGYGKYGRTIINDISFHIKKGESIGIIGASGSGKSTLIKLLTGLFEPKSGKIYFGGYDIETIDLRYLRKHCGVIMQNSRLTVGDLYTNISGNDLSISYDDVIMAVRQVGLEYLIDKIPFGTPLDKCSLSAEEKQRLLFARVIAGKNEFLLFDEATSNLDNLSQSTVINILKDIPATKIIIAQRLSTVEFCDRIIVMK